MCCGASQVLPHDCLALLLACQKEVCQQGLPFLELIHYATTHVLRAALPLYTPRSLLLELTHIMLSITQTRQEGFVLHLASCKIETCHYPERLASCKTEACQ